MASMDILQRQDLLLEVLTDCAGVTALEALPRIVFSRLSWVLDFRRCALVLKEDSEGGAVALLGGAEGTVRSRVSELPEPERTRVQDALDAASFRVQPHGQGTELFVPLVANGSNLGVLWFSGAAGAVFSDADVRLARIASGVLAGAVQRLRQEDTILRQQRVEAELRKTQALLHEAVRAREEFLSIASHELRTPLTSLKLMNQARQRALANGKTLSPDSIQRLLADSDKHIDRLIRLVEQMLDLSRIQAQQLELTPRPLNLGALVREVLLPFESATANAPPLQVDVAEDVVGTWDPQRIEQVVLNLVENARKYGAGKPIDVRVVQEEGWALLHVRDRGIGIRREELPHVFKAFERASNARHLQGLGIGLFVCSRIVAAHHGTLSVESVEGEGSTFTVRLPRASVPPAS